MMTAETPRIAASTYGASTSTFALGQQAGFVGVQQGLGAAGFGWDNRGNQVGAVAATRPPPGDDAFINMLRQQQQLKQEKPAMTTRRLVQVFIADPDENIPLDQSLLYNGEQKLTDATDQELYFEVDIKNILEIHNAQRVKIVNKKVKERVEYLEPVKIRELKMVVVTVAQF